VSAFVTWVRHNVRQRHLTDRLDCGESDVMRRAMTHSCRDVVIEEGVVVFHSVSNQMSIDRQLRHSPSEQEQPRMLLMLS
jgi:hypothetical protein